MDTTHQYTPRISLRVIRPPNNLFSIGCQFFHIPFNETAFKTDFKYPRQKPPPLQACESITIVTSQKRINTHRLSQKSMPLFRVTKSHTYLSPGTNITIKTHGTVRKLWILILRDFIAFCVAYIISLPASSFSYSSSSSS